MNLESFYPYVYVLGLILALGLYFVPSLVAVGKQGGGPVIAANLFAGWTVVGWVVALVWAGRLTRKSGHEHRLNARCAAI